VFFQGGGVSLLKGALAGSALFKVTP
jgi:hypothetical protein